MFFFNDTATTEIYTLSLHDALPIYRVAAAAPDHAAAAGPDDDPGRGASGHRLPEGLRPDVHHDPGRAQLQHPLGAAVHLRSEEHTSELQSRQYLVCRLLLEKKKIQR